VEATVKPTPERLTAADLVPDRALVKGDVDRFNHAAIAGRVADLVTCTSTPANIALFGPWGSGKSSLYELIRRDLPASAKPVRYDAWKFAGASLRRNFISHVANELGFTEESGCGEFHKGLYQSRRTVEFSINDLDREHLVGPAKLMAGVFGSVLVALAVLVGAASVFTREDFFGQAADTLPSILASTFVIAVVIAVLNALLAGAKADVDQSSPASEEEFSRTFSRLVEQAHDKAKVERIVVFVDELDRCSAADVVETLSAIKTFLDQDGCVFIVAADRAVVERALNELPQATPYDEENPYYSSASSFIDKVFQHQVVLPPLRGRRLTRYARDLVADSDGVWRELREAPEPRSVDRVMYALIPSHVRSPRRVKVLLNNFATNVRIAEARGIEWKPRAREIAKLTVLETEFPVLAADLHHERRLPSFILDPPATPSAKLERLLKKHRLRAASGSDLGEQIPDPVIAEAAGDDRARLGQSERRHLQRYLERVGAAGVPDPGRDLLYLEPAGAAVDLDDPRLGEILEEEAPEAPDRVIEALGTESVDIRQKAARILADMADDEFGDERANVMTALMGTLEGLGEDARPIAPELVSSVRGFEQEQEMRDDHLVGALALGLAAGSGLEARSLVEDVLANDQLFAEADRVRQVAEMLGRIPEACRPRVYGAVGRFVAADETVLTDPLSTLSGGLSRELLTNADVRAGVGAHVGAMTDDAAEEFYDILYEAAEAGPDPLETGRAIQDDILERGVYRAAVREHAQLLLAPLVGTAAAQTTALRALAIAPAADWAFWSDYLAPPPTEPETQAGIATPVLIERLPEFAGLAAAGDDRGSDLVTALAAFFSADVDPEVVRESAERALQARDWWVDASRREQQADVHALLRHVAAALPRLADMLDDLMLQDLRRAPVSPGATEVYTGFRTMGSLLAARAQPLFADLAPLGAGQGSLLTSARASLARAASAAGVDEAFDIEFGDVVAAANEGSDDAVLALGSWFALDPSLTEVIDLFEQAAGARRPVAQTASERLGRLTAKERTSLAEQLVGADFDAPKWLEQLRKSGVDEAKVVRLIAKQVDAAKTSPQREALVKRLRTFAPGEGAAQREVARIILALLGTGKKVDFEIALNASRALKKGHRAQQALTDAFKQAVDDHGKPIPPDAAKALSAAGVKLPQKSLSINARKVLGFLTGRK